MHENRYHQESRQMPRLRFPDLRETCENFVDWASPFLNGTELAETDRLVRDFLSPSGQGKALQRSLQEAMEEDPSFIEHIPYWNKWYLAQDEPLGLETNPYYLLDLEPSDPLQRAAELTSSALSFCLSIADGTIEPDVHNGQALCMKQYSSIFGAVRIPRKGPDSFVSHAAGQNRKGLPRHVAVLRGGKIFSLQVLDDNGQPYGTEALEEAFRKIATVRRNPSIHAGVLTTRPRHEWAHVREELIRAHKNNEEALGLIEKALFAICLDDTAPADDSESGLLLLSGNNRWYDKSLQIIVFRNGQAGINFEHSHLDGLPLTRLAGYLARKETTGETLTRQKPAFCEVPLALTTKLRERIEKADRLLEKRVSKLGTRRLELPVGKKDIKQCGISPDAFVQLALLLACRRHRGRWVSTSEAVMLRRFEGGRTGVMRTLTSEALAFFTLMKSPTASTSAQAEALRKASAAHARRVGLCLEGHGPEEHLQALLAAGLYLDGKKEDLPRLFTGTAWSRLQDTFVATSTTPPEGLRLAGYGPLSGEGFGGRYMKTDPHILFNLSFWRESAFEPDGFAEKLCTCAEEMISVFETAKTKDSQRWENR